MAVIGPLIASGRSADIFDIGRGRVVRRRRAGPIPRSEVLVMQAAATAGFPVPTIHAVDGADMTMDRIDGVDMLTMLTRRPWKARRVGVMLADLHRQLAAIPVGDTEVPTTIGDPESYVHGDLHPGNVLLTADGPVVIDWENAGLGASDADTTTTWLLLQTAEPDDIPRMVQPLLGLVRRVILRAFLGGVPAPTPQTISAVCAVRLRDPNMREPELRAIRAFSRDHGA